MNKQSKRIIAREGLVLLGVIGIGCLIMVTPELYITPKPVRIEQAESKFVPLTEEQFNKEKEAGFTFDEIVKFEKVRKETYKTQGGSDKVYKFKNPEGTIISVDSPDGTVPTESELDQVFSKVKNPQVNKVYRLSEVIKATEKQDKVKNIGLVIILLGYPVYLLLRFTAWAIRTLKEKL